MNEVIILIISLLVISIWDTVWKLIAAYRAAGNRHPFWFVLLMIINSMGILPIIYLLTHERRTLNRGSLKE